MDQRVSKEFSERGVENAIHDLRKIKLKKFESETLSKLNLQNNNNCVSKEDLDNCNISDYLNGRKSEETMRMASVQNDVMTASCSESESDEPLELIDQLSGSSSGDEGTWLYQSPGSRGVSSSHSTPVRNVKLNEGAGDGMELFKRKLKASPVDWLRRDFDQTPSPEVERARHSLVNKVDEITQGRFDSQTFRIRDSRNQVRKSLQELINFSGPRHAAGTQTSTHECQTEETGMQTSFLDETPPPDGDSDASSDVSNLVNEIKSRTFTRSKKNGGNQSEVAYEGSAEEEEQKARVGDGDNDEEGGGEEPASYPHLPARVDSSTFTRPIKRNLRKKISREPLGIATSDEEDASRRKKEEEGQNRPSPITERGENDADILNNNKPKILGSATITRSAGRRVQPQLRLNGAPDDEVGEKDDSRSSSPASRSSSLPSTEESPRHRAKTAETRPDSRASPVVWDNNNFDKPADMVDVQVMARMQEDSLRRSIIVNRGAEKPKLTGIVQPLTPQNAHGRNGLEKNSTLPSPYSKYGTNSRRIGNGATDDGYSVKPRIGREDSASSMHSVDSNPGARSGSDSMSVHSATPPDSPLGGSRSDLQSSSRPSGRRSGSGSATPAATRRSLPNLAQSGNASGLSQPHAKAKPATLSSIRNTQPALKTHTSDSNLRDKTGLKQPAPTSRLKPPASNLRAPSPGSAANRSVSPGIPRGIVSPTPRTIPSKGSSIARPTRGTSSGKPLGIPRGASHSSQPRRSGLQPSRGSSRNAAPEWAEDYY